MTWREVNPSLLKRAAGLQTRWYCDDQPTGGGGLHLWLDEAERLVGLQLELEEWPAPRHYIASWRTGELPRIGTVDEGRRGAMGVKPAALVRYEHVDPRAVDSLQRYFGENADCVPAPYRQAIEALLGEVSAQAAA